MTRGTQVTQAVSAMRKARAAPSPVSEPDSMKFVVVEAEPDSMKFAVVEENGGRYHWAIVARGGKTLAQSASFASCEEAKQAARIVHGGASSASFEDRSSDVLPFDLHARRNGARARDRLDAERWLDEGGSFSSEAVTR